LHPDKRIVPGVRTSYRRASEPAGGRHGKCHTGKADPTLSVETNDADQRDENTETTAPRHRL
jgi:hypothetical protein